MNGRWEQVAFICCCRRHCSLRFTTLCLLPTTRNSKMLIALVRESEVIFLLWFTNLEWDWLRCYFWSREKRLENSSSEKKEVEKHNCLHSTWQHTLILFWVFYRSHTTHNFHIKFNAEIHSMQSMSVQHTACHFFFHLFFRWMKIENDQPHTSNGNI